MVNGRLLLSALLLVTATTPVTAADFFEPPSGAGPAVVVISGASGTFPYRWYARDVAKLGYAVALVSGKEICATHSGSCSRTDEESLANLKKTIADLQANKQVVPGKVAVVSFSLGGGGALLHAAPLADTVAGVVAYYPSISKTPDLGKVADRVAVPTLLFGGGQDKYFNCCLVESMRQVESGVKARSVPIELVVYPNADHGFNLDGSKHRPDDTADAWERTSAFLTRVLPLK